MTAFPDSHIPPALLFEEDQRSKEHQGKYDGNPLGLSAYIRVEHQYKPWNPKQKNQAYSQYPLIGKDPFPDLVVE